MSPEGPKCSLGLKIKGQLELTWTQKGLREFTKNGGAQVLSEQN